MQTTIRGIPADLEAAIRAEAARQGQSLNRTMVGLLRTALGLGPPQRQRRDLSALAGSWTAPQAAEFDDAVAVFEEVDEELWR